MNLKDRFSWSRQDRNKLYSELQKSGKLKENARHSRKGGFQEKKEPLYFFFSGFLLSYGRNKTTVVIGGKIVGFLAYYWLSHEEPTYI